MVLAVSPEVGFWWTFSTLRKYRGVGSQTEQVGARLEKTVENRKTTNLPSVRE